MPRPISDYCRFMETLPNNAHQLALDESADIETVGFGQYSQGLVGLILELGSHVLAFQAHIDGGLFESGESQRYQLAYSVGSNFNSPCVSFSICAARNGGTVPRLTHFVIAARPIPKARATLACEPK